MGVIAEAFAAYAQPLLDQTDGSEEQLNKAFAIGQLCYNLAVLPEDGRDQMLREMRSSLEMDDEQFDDFRRCIVLPMIRRHQEMFPRMHSRGSTRFSQVGPSPTGPSLGAPQIQAARSEARPRTDPYAPCPCNSGRKYKFCCGKRGR
jgi:SEC-C motif